MLQIVENAFPGAAPGEAVLARCGQALAEQGFAPTTAQLVLAVCRDELTRPFARLLESGWGNAFDMAGLAGVPAGGVTALQAALHHAPTPSEPNQPPRLVLMTLAHIAFGEAGELGVCHRPKQKTPSGACGALLGIRKGWEQSTRLDDPQDTEFTRLRTRLKHAAGSLTAPDLLTLTRFAHDDARREARQLIEGLAAREALDAALVTGVQIHVHGQDDYVWLGSGERFRDKQWHPLPGIAD